MRGTRRLALDQRGPADEIALMQTHEALEPGLEGIVVEGDVLLPGDVALLEPQTVHRIDAEIGDAVPASALAERVIDAAESLHRHMQLPAELADVVDA